MKAGGGSKQRGGDYAQVLLKKAAAMPALDTSRLTELKNNLSRRLEMELPSSTSHAAFAHPTVTVPEIEGFARPCRFSPARMRNTGQERRLGGNG